MAKCNLPPEERREILTDEKNWYHEAEELDRCKPFFNQFLFVEIPEWDKKVRICTCSNCEQSWAVKREENKQLFALHHQDATECPHCGKILTLQMLGRLGKDTSCIRLHR